MENYTNILLMAPPQNGAGGDSGMGMLIMFGAMFLIMYFLIIRPQQKRQKQLNQMLNNLQKDDNVITSAGIHGSVIDSDEKTVLLKIADGVNVRFEKAAIANKK